MKLNVESPGHVIDITGVEGLASYNMSLPRELVFGSLALMSDVADDPVVQSQYPALSGSLWKAASQQLATWQRSAATCSSARATLNFRATEFPCNKRAPGSGCSAIDGVNRGDTVLGVSDACIAVYPGDFAVALAAFDAVIEVVGPGGVRSIPLIDFHLAPGITPHLDTALATGELITRIRVTVTRAGKASTYQKIRDRESYAFALTSAAVALDFAGGRVTDARIALGGVATKPWRARAAEQSLIGQPLTENTRSARRATGFCRCPHDQAERLQSPARNRDRRGIARDRAAERQGAVRARLFIARHRKFHSDLASGVMKRLGHLLRQRYVAYRRVLEPLWNLCTLLKHRVCLGSENV